MDEKSFVKSRIMLNAIVSKLPKRLNKVHVECGDSFYDCDEHGEECYWNKKTLKSVYIYTPARYWIKHFTHDKRCFVIISFWRGCGPVEDMQIYDSKKIDELVKRIKDFLYE